MKQNILETLVGLIVLIITSVFFIFAYNSSGTSKNSNSYVLKASFQTGEGIVKGSDIKISGIKIGSVTDITLDKDNFSALMVFNIDDSIKLPKDSKASVVTSGIIGDKYISINPGSSEEILAANDKIIYTQSALNIESLIGKLVSSFINK